MPLPELKLELELKLFLYSLRLLSPQHAQASSSAQLSSPSNMGLSSSISATLRNRRHAVLFAVAEATVIIKTTVPEELMKEGHGSRVTKIKKTGFHAIV